MEEKGISLFELNKNIQEAIRNSLEISYWIKAEIAQIKENFSGHCYIELVDKDTKSDKILAQAKGTIWGNTYRILKPYFKTTTGRELTVGMKILISVRVEFHELYGLSLNVTDIDPSYTVGDLALKKAAIIKQLQDEGVFDMNKELEMPIVPQRIAVISSETAAGYTDFISHINENTYGYCIQTKLFPATMQGAKAEESIISALDAIYSQIEKFDAVVIIRGGGSQIDLSCFDSYLLACNVAQMPIPVITGIGHEQDDSITDLVAHTRLKTPTAVAAYIIDAFLNFENELNEFQQHVIELTNDIVIEHNNYLENIFKTLPSLAKERMYSEITAINQLSFRTSKSVTSILIGNKFQQQAYFQKLHLAIHKYTFTNSSLLNNYKTNINKLIKNKLQHEGFKLDTYQNTANLTNPEHTLKQGYSITLFNGKPLSNAEIVKNGDAIQTILHKGKLISEVKETEV